MPTYVTVYSHIWTEIIVYYVENDYTWSYIIWYMVMYDHV